MATDYSAMESVIRKLEGTPIKPKALYKELETGCLRAVPDNDLAAELFTKFFAMTAKQREEAGNRTRTNFEKYYQWHLSGKKWEDYFDSIEILPIEQTWACPPRIHKPEEKPKELPPNVSHSNLAKWLILNVLRDPSKLNTYFESRLTRDLIYKSATTSTGGMYFNESSAVFDGMNSRVEFNFDIAYDQMVAQCNRRNSWEQRRIELMQSKMGTPQ